MKKADLKQHLETYCIYRPQTCEFCSREIALTNLQVSNILFCLFIIYNNYDYKLVLVILVDKKKKRPGHGLPGKSCAKFRTGKFRPEIAFTICTISAIYRKKNDCEGLKLVLKMALKKGNTNFRLEYSFPKEQDYLFRCFFAPRNFLLQRPKKSCFLFFQPGFPFFFCNSGKQSPFSHRT